MWRHLHHQPSVMRSLAVALLMLHHTPPQVSGKDLIQNHLTFSLYNHVAVWPKGEACCCLRDCS